MRIDKLEIKGFGKLTEKTVTFKEGFNLIYGSNEAGKTSLQWFIKAMLFGLKGGKVSKEGLPPPLKRFKPWNGSEFSGSMEYRLDGGDGFRAVRNFAVGTTNIYDAFFNDITGTFDISREKGVSFGERHLGINEACFERTVFVRQLETRIDEEGSRELLDRLTNAAETGFEDVSFKRAQEALREALKSHVGTGKTTTRPMDKVLERLEVLKARREEAVKRREAAFALEEELKRAAVEIEELEAVRGSLKQVRQQREAQTGVEQLKKMKWSLEEITAALTKDQQEIRTIQGCLSGIQEELGALKSYTSMESGDADRLEADFYRLKGLKEENARLEEKLVGKLESIKAIEAFLREGRLEPASVAVKKENQQPGSRRQSEKIKSVMGRSRLYKVMAGVLAVVAAAEGVLGTGKPALGMLAAAGAAFMAGMFVLLAVREGKILKALRSQFGSMTEEGSYEEAVRRKAEYDIKAQQLAELRQDVKRMEGMQLANLNKIMEMEAALAAWLPASLADAEGQEFGEEQIREWKEGLRRFQSLQAESRYTAQRQEDLKAAMERQLKSAEALCGKRFRTLEELDSYVQTLNGELTEHEKSQETRFGEAGSTVGAIEQELQGKEEQIQALRLRMKEAETRLEGINAEDETLQQIDEEVSQLEDKKKQLEDVNASLNTALELLTEASLELQRDYAPALNDRMSDLVGKITGGRYQQLKADDKLALKVIAPETGDVVQAGLLSGGTTDQMYLALRIAMAEVLTRGKESLPLILDEAFAQYDDDRTLEAFGLLHRIQSQNQVLFFTCKGREVELAREVFGKALYVVEL